MDADEAPAQPQPASVELDGSVAASAPGSSPPLGTLEGLRELVERAFEMARERKPEHWQSMTVAVLKNRMLQLTDRNFDEAHYGVHNMRDLVGLLPGLLEVDDTTLPPTVTLRENTSIVPRLPPPKGKIRSDLWNAVIDYASGKIWVWVDGSAVADLPELSDSSSVLPTLTVEEMQRWRHEFAATHGTSLEVQDAARLESWAAGAGRTQQLPLRLRRSWNDRLKTGVLERLLAWFDDRKEEAPEDIVVAAESRSVAPDRPAPDLSTSLRGFLTACIASMSDDELATIGLPVGAVWRFVERDLDL